MCRPFLLPPISLPARCPFEAQAVPLVRSGAEDQWGEAGSGERAAADLKRASPNY
jgi:hypothetical protein